MSDGENELLSETTTEKPQDDNTTAVAESAEEQRLDLEVEVEAGGPCRKHVRVKVSRADIDRIQSKVVEELTETADVPGFRKRHIPAKLIGRRFRQEISDDVRQKILVRSLEQLSEENDLDPIDEPNLDIESISIPDEGDFEYEFDVEVRPEFELPDYRGLKIRRPTRDVTDEDVDEYLERFLGQYGELLAHQGPAEKGHYVTVSITFHYNGDVLRELSDLNVCLKPTLRFRDAEISAFDELLAGTAVGDSATVDLAISPESEVIEMRGETVQAEFLVEAIKELKLPELTKKFLNRVGVDSEEELRVEVSQILERQVTYQQRQSTRQQVLEKITESANWRLPEDLVAKQVENAMHRQTLEMQQAGFTTRDIRARENELRQKSITTTERAMKEHFVLDKIATEENLEITPQDIETELQLMALQSGENPRRLRARLVKSGVIENLEAQIRERKAVDFILGHAQFEDVEMDCPTESDVEAINQAICHKVTTAPATEKESEDTEDTEAASAE